MITNSNWKIFWDRGHMSPIFYSTYKIIFNFKLWISIISVYVFLAFGAASAITFKKDTLLKVFKINIFL